MTPAQTYSHGGVLNRPPQMVSAGSLSTFENPMFADGDFGMDGVANATYGLICISLGPAFIPTPTSTVAAKRVVL